MKKYIAKQIDPGIQTSPMFYGGSIDMESWPDISLFGNRQYGGYMTPAFEQLVQNIEEAYGDFYNLTHENNPWFSSVREIVHAYFPYGEEYTEAQIDAFGNVLYDWDYAKTTNEEHPILCRAMEIMTGKPHEITTIKGCCQSDWQYVCYPSDEYDRHALDVLETEYFNTGTEWEVTEEPCDLFDLKNTCAMADMVENAASICGIYTHGWRSEDIKQEIAEAMDIPADELILLEHDGYMHISKYKIG